VRRIGILSSFPETNSEAKVWDTGFRERLNELGWIDGRNIRIDYRWGGGNVDWMPTLAKELIDQNPEVLLAVTTPATAALLRETRSIPIVFAIVADPIGSRFVASLARPGGNVTGFLNNESSLSGKWLGLLREIAPHVVRVGFMFNPNTAPYARNYLDTFRSAAAALGAEPSEVPVYDAVEIEAAMAMLGHERGAGLVVMPDTSIGIHQELIISLAERYHIPVVYPFRYFVTDGGLISYGIDLADQLRGAASYVDRILRGAKPDDLPVQLPTKFELAVNLKTAKALGLDVPSTLLALADEVIE
jgi:putative ABC transport system substrate-binding protein